MRLKIVSYKTAETTLRSWWELVLITAVIVFDHFAKRNFTFKAMIGFVFNRLVTIAVYELAFLKVMEMKMRRMKLIRTWLDVKFNSS